MSTEAGQHVCEGDRLGIGRVSERLAHLRNVDLVLNRLEQREIGRRNDRRGGTTMAGDEGAFARVAGSIHEIGEVGACLCDRQRGDGAASRLVRLLQID